MGRAAQAAREAAEQLDPLAAPAGVLKSTKSLVAARALNGSLHDEASGMHLARMGSDVALARTAAGAAATQVGGKDTNGGGGAAGVGGQGLWRGRRGLRWGKGLAAQVCWCTSLFGACG